MSSIASTLSLVSLQDDNAAWKLLRAKNAPAIIAILDTHLGGQTRRLLVQELVNLVEIDLEELRFKTDLELTRSAQAYCEQWRANGYLVRRLSQQRRQETYELSGDALSAIGFAKNLIKPHRSVTQSRLAIIVDSINKLAIDTDRDVERRRSALLEERARIDDQLVQLDVGGVDVLEPDQALERARDIVSLAQEIPADFLHVRADFERISKQLHAAIINSEAESGDILRDVFAGVDHIGQSPSGRSFHGFYSLLRDPVLSEGVQDSIDSILECDFAEDLVPEDRRFLRNLLREFLVQSQEANTTKITFSRGLQRFVQNQSYQQDRLIKRQLDQALGKAHSLVDAYSCIRRLSFSLDLTSIDIKPVSRWQLKNPAETRTAPLDLEATAQAPVMTFAQLQEAVRETEIDFTELVGNVNRCLADCFGETTQYVEANEPALSVGDVLRMFPATQGVASVVGILSLAIDQGRRCPCGETETVFWQSRSGVRYWARIERLEFYRKVFL